MMKKEHNPQENIEKDEFEDKKQFAPDSSCCSDVDDDEMDEKEVLKEQAKKRSNYGNYKYRHGEFEERLQSKGEKFGDWFKAVMEKVKEELLRFSKIAKVKLDIMSLKKKKDERLKLIGKRAIELVNSGFIDADMIEPEYSMIKSIDIEIENKKLDLNEVSKRPNHSKDEPRAIEAKSIPMDKKEI